MSLAVIVLLVERLLAGFAYTTRVPRQEDIGIDFLCSLIIGEGGENLLKAGPFFTVQAKSSTKGIAYQKPHDLESINAQNGIPGRHRLISRTGLRP